MKKIVLSLFALSTIASFATTSSSTKDLNSAGFGVDVTATIVEQAQLVILENDGSELSNGRTTLAYGEIKKSEVEGDLTKEKTMLIKRSGGNDPLLFDASLKTITTNVTGGKSLTLSQKGTNTTLAGSLETSGVTLADSGKSATFTIKSTLSKDSILDATAGNYSGSKEITVTIGS